MTHENRYTSELLEKLISENQQLCAKSASVGGSPLQYVIYNQQIRINNEKIQRLRLENNDFIDNAPSDYVMD